MKMNTNSHSCEKSCPHKISTENTQLIVITGGPGAGKTAVLEIMRKILCEHVTVFPEAASILFGGGFWRLTSDSALRAQQRAIFHIQHEMQNLVVSEKRWVLGLCDRGTLDGMAYWPGDAKNFCTELNTTIEKEYTRYSAVIHLSTPSLEMGYNYQNPIRTESVEEAVKIDKKIHEVWKNHPHYFQIRSAHDFIAKVYKSYSLIKDYLPECCRKNLTTEVV